VAWLEGFTLDKKYDSDDQEADEKPDKYQKWDTQGYIRRRRPSDHCGFQIKTPHRRKNSNTAIEFLRKKMFSRHKNGVVNS
jgi:hypothetical protein